MEYGDETLGDAVSERLANNALRSIFAAHSGGLHGVCLSGCIRADANVPDFPCDARIATAIALGVAPDLTDAENAALHQGQSVPLHELKVTYQ
jgi:hypothetical protein